MFKKVVCCLLLVCVFCGFLPLVNAVENVQGQTPSASVMKDIKILNDTVSDGGIFNDAKFKFICFDISEHSYKVTVSRRDHDFDDKYVQFIYVIMIQSNNKIISVPKYVVLKPGQKNITLTENMYADSFISLKKSGYGIKFPSFEDLDDDDRSINDAVFNLRLTYIGRWWITTFVANPYMEYELYRRDGKNMDCYVTLRHAISIYKEGVPPQVEWASFEMHPNSHFVKDYTHNMPKLTGFQSNADEYYIQFTKEKQK